VSEIPRSSGDHYRDHATLCSVPGIVHAVTAATAGSEQAGHRKQKSQTAREAGDPVVPRRTASPNASGEEHGQQNESGDCEHHGVSSAGLIPAY